MIERVRDSWNSAEELSDVLLSIIERQLELAGMIASQEASLNAAFISEREDMYKGTDSMAKAKAKAIVGTHKTSYEYEFDALNNLIKVVISRIALLQGVSLPAQ